MSAQSILLQARNPWLLKSPPVKNMSSILSSALAIITLKDSATEACSLAIVLLLCIKLL